MDKKIFLAAIALLVLACNTAVVRSIGPSEVVWGQGQGQNPGKMR